ncbi:MAG: 4-hydroxy-tetrahydrodipicolinate reductase [Nitrospinae bacterium]|nr:4-hydroxy-tetrahydrodipicolinate reductase [Nitrospinota bacterium]
MVNIAVNGAGGRMGQEIINVISSRPDANLSGAFEREGTPIIGTQHLAFSKIKYEVINEATVNNSDVIIDFTAPQATIRIIEKAVDFKKPLVIGTTGLSKEVKDMINIASKQIPIVFAPNMSVGVNLLFKLVELAAKTLEDEYDIEIIEAHHKHKKDAPSGTAVKLAEIAAETLGRSYEENVQCERNGIIGERPDKEIGVQTIRGGDIVGEHNVMYIGEGERLELIHKATNRNIFAKGAVRAAVWLKGKDIGLYNMFDVLNLK